MKKRNKMDNRPLLEKVSDSKALNLMMPISNPKNKIKKALRFKHAKAMLKMAKPKHVDYVPFETICEKNNLTEKELAKRYRVSSSFALISILAFVYWFSYGIISLTRGDILSSFACFSTTMPCLAIYFRNAVEAYCFRTRQTYSKLSFLSSLEHIIPNPFHEFADISVVEKDGEIVKKLNAFLLSKVEKNI
ncbi:hypothetical protein [Klebsiella pneumoniae]|uniref:hypothetical protein n=1 Tax=Klebsiella pneumoniae TaxID=573 RepID=UPI0029623821|nr:hypothetical protein [Klebsiella pneumoniae]MDW1257560.1 hypothetical protein [Klebsiella pneumoniae]